MIKGAIGEIRPGRELARGSRSSVSLYGDGAIVKIPSPSTPDSWIAYEARYAAALYAVGAPVPRLLGMTTVEGRSASVYEFVEGRSLWEDIVDRPEAMGEHAHVLAAAQVQIFSLVPPLGLPAQRDRLGSKIRRAARLFDPSLVAAINLLPPTDRLRVCHGDMHPSNIIMNARSGPIVVDWFDGSLGDPVADVARTLILLARASGNRGARNYLDGGTPALIDSLRSSYVEAISELMPIDAEGLRQWEVVSAVAQLAEGVDADGALGIWREWSARHQDSAAGNSADSSTRDAS
jgi:tRNA A-37 threonylcarbamoyl transferase component Bud32